MSKPASAFADRNIFAQREFSALGTIALVATRPESLGVAESLLREELRAIDSACSRFQAGSEISRVNLAHGHPVPISQLLTDAVAVALWAAAVTDGAVDPTVGASLIGLGYDRDFDEIAPHNAPVASGLRPGRGWKCIELDVKERVLSVPEGEILDLGATAKAFAADRAAAQIADVTGAEVLVNLGGDISVAGSPPEGWAVGIAPDCATSPLCTDVVVAVRTGGLATSGTSVRTWRRGGRQVHHIIDPRTGDSAVTCWQLVSVAAPSCVEANAGSTAAIVWGAEAPARLSELGLPCRLVDNDGAVVTLGGWPVERDRTPVQTDRARGPRWKAAC